MKTFKEYFTEAKFTSGVGVYDDWPEYIWFKNTLKSGREAGEIWERHSVNFYTLAYYKMGDEDYYKENSEPTNNRNRHTIHELNNIAFPHAKRKEYMTYEEFEKDFVLENI